MLWLVALCLCDPLGKEIVREMDALISGHVAWNDKPQWEKLMAAFFTPNFTYDTVKGFPGSHNYTGVDAWYHGEHIPWNLAFSPVRFTQMLFLGDPTNRSATTASYANAVWSGALTEMQPSHKSTVVRICDFYRVEPDASAPHGGRITYNWMMIDFVAALQERGVRLLPRPALPELFRPPDALDGLPAPTSFIYTPADADAARAVAAQVLQTDFLLKGPSPLWAADLRFYGPAGIGAASGLDEYARDVLGVLQRGFANPELDVDVLVCEGPYCGAHGRLHATHAGTFLGEPATHRRVQLRFGAHWHIRDGKAVEGWLMLDLPALFAQFGVDLLGRATGGLEGPGAVVRDVEAAPQRAEPAPQRALEPAEFNNACLEHKALNPPTKGAPATFLPQCPAWIIETTDAMWHAPMDPGPGNPGLNASAKAYFAPDWVSYSDRGMARGFDALVASVRAKRAAFPDLEIRITDVVCQGNDVDGYKVTMPDWSVGTNTGPSEFGPATNRRVSYLGMAWSFVQKRHGRWQYTAEYVMHDTAGMLRQLQLADRPVASAVPEAPACHQALPWATGHQYV